jgi:tRNA 2-thiouridine synthesizing protein A
MSGREHYLDLVGLKCPWPALKTEKFLKSLTLGETVRMVCTDELAVLDIPNLLNRTGDALLEQNAVEGRLTFLIRKSG